MFHDLICAVMHKNVSVYVNMIKHCLLWGPFNNDPALPANPITICKDTGGAQRDSMLAEVVNKTDNSFLCSLGSKNTRQQMCIVSVVKRHGGCA